MMNVLILGHSFVTNLRRLCENPEKPHEWEDPGNARGKVSVQMHGYPGGRVKTLITAIEAGLFVHYTPHVVIQIPPSVSTIKLSGRTQSFVGLHSSNVRPNCPTKLSDKILPGRSESLHSQIVKL
jgi:hypothetical protein